MTTYFLHKYACAFESMIIYIATMIYLFIFFNNASYKRTQNGKSNHSVFEKYGRILALIKRLMITFKHQFKKSLR